jgi:hypothetical protein
MCPACLANAVLVAVGAASSGGFTTLLFVKFHGRKHRNQNRRKPR